jgi:hypothetical protein
MAIAKASVRVATAEALPECTFTDNFLTGVQYEPSLAVDGVADLMVEDRVLVKNEADAQNNGIYRVHALGVPPPITISSAGPPSYPYEEYYILDGWREPWKVVDWVNNVLLNGFGLDLQSATVGLYDTLVIRKSIRVFGTSGAPGTLTHTGSGSVLNIQADDVSLANVIIIQVAPEGAPLSSLAPAVTITGKRVHLSNVFIYCSGQALDINGGDNFTLDHCWFGNDTATTSAAPDSLVTIRGGTAEGIVADSTFRGMNSTSGSAFRMQGATTGTFTFRNVLPTNVSNNTGTFF